MPLIIDTYKIPAEQIAMAIFRNPNIQPLSVDLLLSGSFIDDNKLFYIHKEIDYDLRKIKYYFNEIIEVDTFIIRINKQSKTLKYYRYYMDGGLKIEEIKQNKKTTTFDKTSFLPHLKAQEDELVIFPEEDDE